MTLVALCSCPVQGSLGHCPILPECTEAHAGWDLLKHRPAILLLSVGCSCAMNCWHDSAL